MQPRLRTAALQGINILDQLFTQVLSTLFESSVILKNGFWTSLVVQWLRLCSYTAQGAG